MAWHTHDDRPVPAEIDASVTQGGIDSLAIVMVVGQNYPDTARHPGRCPFLQPAYACLERAHTIVPDCFQLSARMAASIAAQR